MNGGGRWVGRELQGSQPSPQSSFLRGKVAWAHPIEKSVWTQLHPNCGSVEYHYICSVEFRKRIFVRHELRLQSDGVLADYGQDSVRVEENAIRQKRFENC